MVNRKQGQFSNPIALNPSADDRQWTKTVCEFVYVQNQGRSIYLQCQPVRPPQPQLNLHTPPLIWSHRLQAQHVSRMSTWRRNRLIPCGQFQRQYHTRSHPETISHLRPCISYTKESVWENDTKGSSSKKEERRVEGRVADKTHIKRIFLAHRFKIQCR